MFPVYTSDAQRHTNQFVDTSTSKDCIVLGRQRLKTLHDAVDEHKIAADCHERNLANSSKSLIRIWAIKRTVGLFHVKPEK